MSKAIGPLIFFIIMFGVLLLLGWVLNRWGRQAQQPLMRWIAVLIFVIAGLLGIMLILVIYWFGRDPQALHFKTGLP